MEITFKECLRLVCQQAEILGEEFVLKWPNGGTLRQDIATQEQYKITKRCIHDGTLVFTHELIRSAMLPLWRQTSAQEGFIPEEGDIPHYTIGKIELNNIQEYDKPQRMTWPTTCEEISIPVSVVWEKK